MKASAFNYVRATSVENALELLAVHGNKARVLAGGQSLIPAMNLRLVSPELIIDIGELSELSGITAQGKYLRIGALTRHVDLLRSAEIESRAPLLANAVAHVAHPAIRNRGTIGGNLAHADPASELPACMLALDVIIVARSQARERHIKANDFFRSIYETALLPDELVVAVEVPTAAGNCLHFFHEFARRRGDYAMAGLAAHAVVQRGTFEALRLAFFAVSDRPRLASVGDRLVNVQVTPELFSDILIELGDELVPLADQQATVAMRRYLAKVLLTRSIVALLGRSDLQMRVA